MAAALRPAAGDAPLIQLSRVSKVYRRGAAEVRALDGLSLEVRDGEWVAVMGPSGSGKSTLLGILGCLDRPTGGEYRLLGRSVSELDDGRLSALRNRAIGFVFQSFHLIPQLSVLENVETPLLPLDPGGGLRGGRGGGHVLGGRGGAAGGAGADRGPRHRHDHGPAAGRGRRRRLPRPRRRRGGRRGSGRGGGGSAPRGPPLPRGGSRAGRGRRDHAVLPGGVAASGGGGAVPRSPRRGGPEAASGS